MSARAKPFCRTFLHTYLEKHGLLSCARCCFDASHIIVLTGVDGDTIYFDDPDRGSRKINPVHWFSTKVKNRIDGRLMCRDSDRY